MINVEFSETVKGSSTGMPLVLMSCLQTMVLISDMSGQYPQENCLKTYPKTADVFQQEHNQVPETKGKTLEQLLGLRV